MKIMKVLLLIEKYQSGRPDWPLSPNEWLYGRSLASTGLADVSTFHYDEMACQLGQPGMGEWLLLICATLQPDLVICCPLGWQNIDPPRTIIQAISKTMGIKVLAIRIDGQGENRDGFNRSWIPFVDFITFLDASLKHVGYSKNPKAIRGFCTPNPNFFYDKRLKRDIDVSFVGSCKGYRPEYIQFLREHGINVVTAGGLCRMEPVEPIPWEECINIISRSKIGLNFCKTDDGFSQTKGRIFDTTALNTLLLEDEGVETKEFFEEGKDFVMYRTKEELLEKIKYYLEHDEERKKIAQSGHKKTCELYNPKNIWGYLFSKMGFEIPESLANDKHFQELYEKLESQLK